MNMFTLKDVVLLNNNRPTKPSGITVVLGAEGEYYVGNEAIYGNFNLKFNLTYNSTGYPITIEYHWVDSSNNDRIFWNCNDQLYGSHYFSGGSQHWLGYIGACPRVATNLQHELQILDGVATFTVGGTPMSAPSCFNSAGKIRFSASEAVTISGLQIVEL